MRCTTFLSNSRWYPFFDDEDVRDSFQRTDLKRMRTSAFSNKTLFDILTERTIPRLNWEGAERHVSELSGDNGRCGLVFRSWKKFMAHQTHKYRPQAHDLGTGGDHTANQLQTYYAHVRLTHLPLPSPTIRESIKEGRQSRRQGRAEESEQDHALGHPQDASDDARPILVGVGHSDDQSVEPQSGQHVEAVADLCGKGAARGTRA